MDDISDIKNRRDKIEQLVGIDLCISVSELDENSTREEWINAWNIDQGIIKGIVNDVELQCGIIDLENEIEK